MYKKINLLLSFIRREFNKKINNITIFTKKRRKIENSFTSFFYTSISSFFIIVFSFSSPFLVNTYKNFFYENEEINNNSKINFEKTLSGQTIEQDDGENNSTEIFEDIFEFESLPSDVVRLNALTIEQLFKDTNYSLDEVRKSKLVKPINLSLLPNEMKMIESTKKRKNLFIQIILPLILEENNKIKFDRKRLFGILNKNNNSTSEIKWLNMKFKQYGVKNKDLLTLKVRMDEVPVSLAIAQAAKETGWGTSRFALEGNALFGQWTYSGEGIKPSSIDSDKSHKIMKFKVLQASIRAYHRNLNTHSSYRKFRKLRAEARDNDEELDSLILADSLDQYAATGKEYTKILKKIISQNLLKDFDNVKLLPTSKKLKNLI
tara:strand:- start:977 stop:2104 length:1128 start_codon:yes stop_codon:yes gene_type:complete